MQSVASTSPPIRIVALESDPLWFTGLRTVLAPQSDFELISASLTELSLLRDFDLVLLRNHPGCSLFEVMETVKATCPDLRILVTGSGMVDEAILNAISAGAKGYIDAAAGAAELVQAIRVVSQDSVWAPRRVLCAFVERASSPEGFAHRGERFLLTDQEKQMLKMLMAGLSNREISAPLGMEVRAVRSQIGKLMRKVGVQNRVALSIHAVTHSLV